MPTSSVSANCVRVLFKAHNFPHAAQKNASFMRITGHACLIPIYSTNLLWVCVCCVEVLVSVRGVFRVSVCGARCVCSV